jgi:hypothetical protein
VFVVVVVILRVSSLSSCITILIFHASCTHSQLFVTPSFIHLYAICWRDQRMVEPFPGGSASSAGATSVWFSLRASFFL